MPHGTALPVTERQRMACTGAAPDAAVRYGQHLVTQPKQLRWQAAASSLPFWECRILSGGPQLQLLLLPQRLG
jgi:hypothetical protein